MGKINTLYDFHKAEVPAAVLKVTISRARIAQELRETAERFLSIEAVQGNIAAGDIVRLKLESSLEEYQNEDAALSIGKGYYPDALENALVGKCVGDVLELTLDGASVKATVLSAKRRMVPALTDAKIAALSIEGVETIPAYTEYVKQKLVKAEKRTKNSAIWKIVSKKILEGSDITVSEEELEARRTQILREFDEIPEAEREKTLLQATKAKNLEEADQFIRAECEKSEKLSAAGLSLAQSNNVVWNEETYEDEIKKYVAMGMDEADVRARFGYEAYLSQQPIGYLSDEILAYFDTQYTVELCD